MSILIIIALCLAILCMLIALPSLWLTANHKIANYLEWWRGYK